MSDSIPACTGRPLDDFFPREHEQLSHFLPRLTETAYTYCLNCPIYVECKSQLASVTYGVWGAHFIRWSPKNSGYEIFDLLFGGKPVIRRSRDTSGQVLAKLRH